MAIETRQKSEPREGKPQTNIEEAEVAAPFQGTAPWIRSAGVGAIAGALGGLLMLAWVAAQTITTGLGPSFALRLFGATFVGPLALVGGGGIVLWGLFLHLLVASSLGAAFEALLPGRASHRGAALAAAIYSMTALVLLTYAVLPVVNATMVARIGLWPGHWVLAHLLYALGLASVPLLRQRLLGGPAPSPRERPEPAVHRTVPAPAGV